MSKTDDLIQPSLEDNVIFKAIYKKVRSVITDDILISSIVHHQYQELYEFNNNVSNAKISIFYDSNGNITNILPKDKTELSKILLEKMLQIDKENIDSKYSNIDESLFEGIDFLLEFYESIKNIFENINIFITKIENIQYGQRYTFVRDNEYAEIIVWYNSKCRITRIQPVKQHPKNSTIGNDIFSVFSELSNC